MSNKYNLLLSLLFIVILNGCSKPDPIITIYGSNQCHHCQDLKKALDSAQMTYTFYDIDTSEAYAREMFNTLQKANKIGGKVSLPVVEVNEEIVLVGANFAQIQKTLD